MINVRIGTRDTRTNQLSVSRSRRRPETVRVALIKELLKIKAQLFKCTEALDGLLTKGMSLKKILEYFRF